MAGYSGRPLDHKSDLQGPDSSIYHSTSSVEDTHYSVLLPRSRQTEGAGELGEGYDREEGCRNSPSTRQSWFLQPSFSSSKEGRYLEAGHRLVLSKQDASDSIVQDGDSGAHYGGSSTGGVVDLVRPDRCLFSCTDSPQVQEISSICGGRSGLPVHGSTFRAVDSSVRFHETGEVSSIFRASSRSPRSPVYRRLAPTCTRPGQVINHHHVATTVAGGSRVQSQLQEVRLNPRTGKGFLGDSPGSHSVQGFPFQGQDSTLLAVDTSFSDVSITNSIELAEIDRSPSVVDKNCSTRRDYAQTCPEGLSLPVESRVSSSVFQDIHERGYEGHSELVVPRDQPQSRGVSTSFHKDSRHLHRCVQSGLGCMHEHAFGARRLATRGKETHKCPRNDGSTPLVPVIPGTDQGQGCHDFFRQLDSGSLCQPPGRDEIHQYLSSGGTAPSAPFCSQCKDTMPTHCGCTQHSGRSPVEDREHPDLDRVVSVTRSRSSHMGEIPSPHGRLIRDTPELQADYLRVSFPPPIGMEGRRFKHVLGRSGCLRIPSHQSAEASSNQSGHTQLQNTAGGSILAQTVLVCGGAESPVLSTMGVTCTSKITPATSVADFSQEPVGVQPSRLALIKQADLRDGYSQEACDFIQSSLKESTIKQYESRWRVFAAWCVDHNINSVNPTIPQIADFLVYLFKVRGILPKSVEVYRSSIAHVIQRHTGLEVGHHQVLNQLIEGMYHAKPTRRRTVPSWDLCIVLQALVSAPFEPCEDVSLKFLTLKTVFLTALATGLRRSELHALSRSSILRHPQGEWIQLKTKVGFLAKTQLHRSNDFFKPIRIPALTTVLTPDHADRRLCPVRMLNSYLRRTQHLLPINSDIVFISFKEGYDKVINMSTISNWLSKTVKEAYLAAGLKDLPSVIKGHDTRALSASLAQLGNVAMVDILESAQWKSKSTFISFYLKDIAHGADGLSTLGPLVAARNIVNI